MIEAVIGFLLVFVLLFFGTPVAFGMIIVGVLGFAWVVGWFPGLAMLGQIAYETSLSASLSVLPLFILMGNFVSRAGLSRELYDCANAFIGHRRGGLAMATVLACGGFAAVSGSSMATSATMAQVSVPEMRKHGYADSLAAGSIAAGGTLGILIPPSVILVLYGIVTGTDIGALFIAGIVPGVIGLLFYLAAVRTITWINPEMGPPGPRADWRQRLRALSRIWGILVLFLVIMGGMYLGVFTPTEAAGIGAGGAFLFVLARRAMTWSMLLDTLVQTARTTSMMFILLIGAIVFSNFINVAGLPRELSNWVLSFEASPMLVMLCILAIYLVLGCLLESLSMMLLTVPIFFPIVQSLGFDPIWFGIIVVVVIEISLITPPIGLNVFVMKVALPDVPTTTIFRGVGVFILADILRLALLLLVPALVLFAPNLMG
ncbi:TRAP transporter large permease [Algihabitans albus]|uniref:TRAP transporter large permease n=1 Tax=Algihabitans albus TaxID=2164067 RepID=UPI000E5C6A13|nr:TRAP transporter large permease [Algihabitans albus]